MREEDCGRVLAVARLICFDCGEDNNGRAEGPRQCARCRIVEYVEAKAQGPELQKETNAKTVILSWWKGRGGGDRQCFVYCLRCACGRWKLAGKSKRTTSAARVVTRERCLLARSQGFRPKNGILHPQI